jgi:hypothetical protein
VQVSGVAQGADLSIAEGSGDRKIGHDLACDRNITVGFSEQPAPSTETGK